MLWDYMLYFAFSYYSIIMNIFNNCKLYLLRVIYNMLHVTINVILFEENMLNGMVTGSRCISMLPVALSCSMFVRKIL